VSTLQLQKRREENLPTFEKGELVETAEEPAKINKETYRSILLRYAWVTILSGRVGFEAAAPSSKHHLLEKHTLGKWQQYWKEQLGNWYGMLFHEGQFLDP
jgi:argininosuccinate synthase